MAQGPQYSPLEEAVIADPKNLFRATSAVRWLESWSSIQGEGPNLYYMVILIVSVAFYGPHFLCITRIKLVRFQSIIHPGPGYGHYLLATQDHLQARYPMCIG